MAEVVVVLVLAFVVVFRVIMIHIYYEH